jgi:TubC N-terminal docking domain
LQNLLAEIGSLGMSALPIIAAAAESGVDLELDGNGLRMRATVKPPDELLARIKEHKPEIIAILRNEPTLEHEAALAAEQGEMDACEARFQAELAELRAANSTVYANPQPWRAK